MSTSSTGASDTSVTQPGVCTASNSSAQAAGGSVIDVSSLVSQLVAATQAPQQAVISAQTQAVTTQISALGTLKSALSTFQSSLSALDTPSAFQVQTANSSDQTAFTASAGSGAVAGTYNVTVSALAQAQQLLSSAFAGGGAATVGTGTLSLSLGGRSFNLTVGAADDSLADIAAAINSATGNPGIAATVLQGTDGAHLVLSSSLTGAANTIQVTESDGGNGLAALTYGTGNTASYTQQAAAQDAAFTISGVAYTSPSNTVTNALGGVTLNLLGTTSAGSNATLSVANDTSTIEGNIGSFVTAYNTLVTAIAPLGSYDAATNTAGPMLGNALYSGTTNQIQQALYSIVNTGSSTNFSAVSQLFSGTNGVAAALNTQLTSDLGASGDFASAGSTLTQQENALTTQTNQLNAQMTALSASLTQQYSALNVLLSSLQTTSAYLTQQFATLPLVQGVPEA